MLVPSSGILSEQALNRCSKTYDVCSSVFRRRPRCICGTRSEVSFASARQSSDDLNVLTERPARLFFSSLSAESSVFANLTLPRRRSEAYFVVSGEGYIVAATLILIGCARSATLPVAADAIIITTNAAPICGSAGAQSVALRHAAIETINRGFDRFIILDGRYQNNVRVIGYTPVHAHTVSSATAVGHGNVVTAHGQSTTYFSGGSPIIAGSHDQGLLVKMFRDDDPAGANAISARQQLGPKWQEIVKENAITTC